MKLSRNIVLSLEIIVAHKLRTLLSVIGIVAEDHSVAQPLDAQVELVAMPKEVSQ